MALTKERKGEIALSLTKMRAKKEGLKLSQNTPREIGAAAKETGIPKKEMLEFFQELFQEMSEEIFKSQIS